MGSGFEGVGFIILFAVILIFAIVIAITRWILRINDIVDRLDKIVTLLAKPKSVAQ